MRILEKPHGWPTHAPAADRLGWIEFVEFLTLSSLKVVHRLDKQTSGILITAESADEAAQLAVHFSERNARKVYHFLSHVIRDDLTYGILDKQDLDGQQTETFIRLVQTHSGIGHYEALPHTGRTHQIRKVAQSLGIPILGDTEYGGAAYHRLALHAQQLEIPNVGSWHSDLPHIFTAPNPLDPILRWHSAIERRKPINTLLRESAVQGLTDSKLAISFTNTLRWIHTDGDPLRADQYGSGLVFYWYESPQDLERMRSTFDHLTHTLDCEFWWARAMLERGSAKTVVPLISSPAAPTRWPCSENGLMYEVRADQGHSFGLFLDQKFNRRWIQHASKQRKVLNLFCYTGAFSVSALMGGADCVDSVDVSRTYGEWLSQNIELNFKNKQTDRHSFFKMDAREYLKWAKKKNKTYDLMIIDPPSFGRSDYGVFRIEHDLKELVLLCDALLQPGGHMLVSCNFEPWTQDKFARLISEGLLHMTLQKPISVGDHELPGEPAILKTLYLHKRLKDS